MFDALSLEQIARKDDYDIIILNGVGNYIDLLKEQILENYKTVILALDNDEAGRRLEEILIERLEDWEVKKLNYSGKDLNECIINDRNIKVEILHKPFYAGTVKDGTINRLVISDSKKVLEKLGAGTIEKISTQEDIQRIWMEENCRGYVEIYSENPTPKWIHIGIKSAEYEEEVNAPYLLSGKTTETVKPTEIRINKYYWSQGEPLFINEIRNNPTLYVDSEIEEVRRLAKKRIRELEEARELENKIRAEREKEEEKNYGLGLGR